MPSPESRHRRGPWWRILLGVLTAGAGSAVGALLLGEYDFSGLLPWFGGPALGLAIAEMLLAIVGRRTTVLGALAGAMAAAALLWAAWISSGEGLTAPPWGLGPGMALAVVAAVVWTGPEPRPAPRRRVIRVRRRPGPSSR